MTLVEVMGLACIEIIGEQLNAKLWCCHVGDFIRVGVVKKDVVENMRVQLSLEGWGKVGELGGIWGSEEALILEDWETVRRPSLISNSSARGVCIWKDSVHFVGTCQLVQVGEGNTPLAPSPDLPSEQPVLMPWWLVTPVPRSSWGALITQTPSVLMDP